MTSISKIANEINEAAPGHVFGRFPDLRKKLKNMKRVPSVIFQLSNDSVNEKEGWAFHTGGREQLQFNIGFEKEERRFRYGVAFSLETSRSLPAIDLLKPKIERFNEFMRLNSSTLELFRMWVWSKGTIIKRDTPVRQITEDEIQENNFIFLGRSVSPDRIEIPRILDCFEQLLPLYCFVEAPYASHPESASFAGDPPFSFSERMTIGGSATSKKGYLTDIEIGLRSNQIKRRLCELLKREPGVKIGDELPSGNGGKIDLVCLLPTGEYDFYEIKPAILARQAIREALPQLLEYSYRRGGKEARQLIVVSQAHLDDISKEFLASLRDKGLPIYYQQVPIA